MYLKKPKKYLKDTHPEITAEWHFEKNNDLNINKISNSGIKVWWRCSKGHEWQARIADRISIKSTNCPCCSNRKICKDNCLSITHPQIAAEWHPTKNGKLTPASVVSGSHKKVWWQCSKGHEWMTVIYCRVAGNCPCCSNRKICKDNCLSITHPQIAAEWHPTKNGKLTPQDVTYGLAKKVWWQCGKGHEWQTSLNSRSKNCSQCPYCIGRLATEEKSLGNLNKKLAMEWHPIKNEELTPYNVTLHYGKKVWWQCEKGHEWQATVDKRSSKRGCPYCSYKKINNTNSLETLNPKVAAEWHHTKNILKPSQVAPNCGKKVWWICKENHEWIVRICNRNKGSGCPHCKSYKSQKKLYEIVKEILPNEEIKFNYKNAELRFPDTNCLLELDIYLINKKIAIEYQGEQHYKPIEYWGGIKTLLYVQGRDRLKRIVCEQKNIKLIEVHYTWKKDKKSIYKLLEEYV